jgi:hypothetical protein
MVMPLIRGMSETEHSATVLIPLLRGRVVGYLQHMAWARKNHTAKSENPQATRGRRTRGWRLCWANDLPLLPVYVSI